MDQIVHIPGRPKTEQPPNLGDLAASVHLHHPQVIRSGVTTTQEGEWAILAVVEKNTPVPIRTIERECLGFPVIYQEDSGRVPVARPAYPGSGE
ncbi:hypothetical protein ACFQ4C_24925 [Larkinella insperata]|uniref:Uncharacterized protein n=1 Tax=Larkinella insperata TaxID=332158 RepID=A0ABW3QDC0_9BACT|nr:hypothetical protein [Larkinella insperata]